MQSYLEIQSVQAHLKTEHWITPQQAAHRFGLASKDVYHRLSRGGFAGRKLPSRVLSKGHGSKGELRTAQLDCRKTLAVALKRCMLIG